MIIHFINCTSDYFNKTILEKCHACLCLHSTSFIWKWSHLKIWSQDLERTSNRSNQVDISTDEHVRTQQIAIRALQSKVFRFGSLQEFSPKTDSLKTLRTLDSAFFKTTMVSSQKDLKSGIVKSELKERHSGLK